MKQVICFGLLANSLVACKKDNTLVAPVAQVSALQQSVLQNRAIHLGIDPLVTTDSLYALKAYTTGGTVQKVDFASLPQTAAGYLSTNYAGFTAISAFATYALGNTTDGYDALITFNNKPVAVRFDATGNFQQVLEQSEGADLTGSYFFHAGGLFEWRDGQSRDTVGISAIPAGVASYFSNNYGGDSILGAFTNKANQLLLLSYNNGINMTGFDASGNLLGRMTPAAANNDGFNEITASALPASVGSYLAATYPGSYIEQALMVTMGGTPNGYTVIADANNTTYSFEFDANGNIVATNTLL